MFFKLIKPVIALTLCMTIFSGVSDSANAQLAYSPGNTSSGYSILKNNSIYFTAENNGNFIKIFSAGDSTKIISQQLSPNGKYIAVTAHDMERTYPFVDVPEEYFGTVFRYGVDIIILDTKGEVLIKLEPDDLLALDWNPEGNKFLCLTGDYEKNPVRSEWRPGDVLSIYDVANKEKIESLVAPQNEYYWDAAWAEYDGKIYIELGVQKESGLHRGIFRYDYKTYELVPTPLQALNISPDGKYCFKAAKREGYLGLYSISTGNEIRFVVPDKILKLDYVKDQRYQGYYRYFTNGLKHFSWIIEGGKTYAVLYKWAYSSLLARMGISGFWKVDCETGICEELAAPKGISTFVSRNDYQMPAGLENGRLVWAVSDGEGNLRASTINNH